MGQKSRTFNIVILSIVVTMVTLGILYGLGKLEVLNSTGTFAIISFFVVIPVVSLLCSVLLGGYVRNYAVIYTILILLCGSLWNRTLAHPIELKYVIVHTLVPSLVGIYFGRYLHNCMGNQAVVQ